MCGPEEEEKIRKEMVKELSKLMYNHQVELGRKAIKNYHN
jgi:hypothetical protein